MTGLLLDTSIVLWAANLDVRLPASAAIRIAHEPGPVLVSAVSVWEIAIKVGIGKLSIDGTVRELVERAKSTSGIDLLPISEADLQAYSELSFPNPNHRDPFDRMLVVQAMGRDLALLTSDSGLKAYGDFVEVV